MLALGTIVAASFYNFRLVSIRQIYDFRNELYFPAPIRYLTGIVSTVLLPFACACYLALNRRWWAAVPLLLMLLFYPITLSKFALFSTAWIVILLVLSRIFEPRAATILSILLPMLLGVILMATYLNDYTLYYFGLVNIRMMATPSSAMDIYNDFFSSHPLTWFCQISFLKPLMSCPYQEQLSVVMEKTYQLGNINASLFATEGIASVGLYLAPLVALACGLVIAFGNRVSAGLPPRLRADLGCAASPDLSQCTLYDGIIDTWRRAPVSAVVHHAAHDVRSRDRTGGFVTGELRCKAF